jgi:hypothetical protein
VAPPPFGLPAAHSGSGEAGKGVSGGRRLGFQGALESPAGRRERVQENLFPINLLELRPVLSTELSENGIVSTKIIL